MLYTVTRTVTEVYTFIVDADNEYEAEQAVYEEVLSDYRPSDTSDRAEADDYRLGDENDAHVIDSL